MASTVTESQLRGRLLHLFVAAIASIAVALVALAISTSRPDSASTAPGDVVESFLAARQVHDGDAATTWFANDVSITDSAGTTVRGRQAARRFIWQYMEFEAGPRQVNGTEVVWTEAMPYRSSDNIPYYERSLPEFRTELPRYAFIQTMCAVVTEGKIHVVVALDAGSPRSCGDTGTSTSWTLGFVFAAATVALLWWLARQFEGPPSSGGRGLIQALAALPACRTTDASGVRNFDKDTPDLNPATRNAVDVHALAFEPFSVFAIRFSLAVLTATAVVVLVLQLSAAPTSSESSPHTPSAESDQLRVIPDSPIHADPPLDTHSHVQPNPPKGPTPQPRHVAEGELLAPRTRAETFKVVTITAMGSAGSYDLYCLTTADQAPFDALVLPADQVMDLYRRLCSPQTGAP